MDVAASLEAVTEDVMLAMGREPFRQTGLLVSCLRAAWRS